MVVAAIAWVINLRGRQFNRATRVTFELQQKLWASVQSQSLSIELGTFRLAVDDDDAASSLGDEVDSVAAIVTELRG